MKNEMGAKIMDGFKSNPTVAQNMTSPYVTSLHIPSDLPEQDEEQEEQGRKSFESLKNKKNKEENKESTGSGSSGGFEGPLFSSADRFINKPKKTETKEATGSGSSGSYETPAAWAKSSSKKNWRGAAKTQIPGGKFVEVKKKCQKFPYCNQGDIKSLNIFENKLLMKVIKNISKKHGISENTIKNIIIKEYKKGNTLTK